MKTIALLIMILSSQSYSYIINGRDLADDLIPQVSVLWSPKVEQQLFTVPNFPLCTATLIGPKTIITAAHCALLLKNYRFGPIGKNKSMYNVNFEIHPNYKRFNYNYPYDRAGKYDFALGVLDRTVVDVRPISVTSEVPSLKDQILILGTGYPKRGVRQYGFMNLYQLSPIGLTMRANLHHREVLAMGDSGGPNFITFADKSISLFAVSSTSSCPQGCKEDQDVETLYSASSRLVGLKDKASFVNMFVSEKKLKVCGLNIQCEKVYFSE